VPQPMRLCVYGLAGSGKSTVSALSGQILADRGHTVDVLKLAEPMYRLQQHIYRTAGIDVDLWEHDNTMLRVLATQLRRIKPDFLATDFIARLTASTADLVINDDLRDADIDYPALAAAGFRFVHVTCDDRIRAARLAARADRTVVPDSAATWGHDRIKPDWTISNSTDDITDLQQQVYNVLDKWLAERSDA